MSAPWYAPVIRKLLKSSPAGRDVPVRAPDVHEKMRSLSIARSENERVAHPRDAFPSQIALRPDLQRQVRLSVEARVVSA